MDKFVFLIRNPIRSALAEFQRQLAGGHTSGMSVHEFRNNSKRFFQIFKSHITSSLPRLAQFQPKQSQPVLTISYEDMTDNLLPQLLRIAHFLEMDSDTIILDRAVCTELNQARIKAKSKRVQKEDLSPLALKVIDKNKTFEQLEKINNLFIDRKNHHMRLKDYQASFDNS